MTPPTEHRLLAQALERSGETLVEREPSQLDIIPTSPRIYLRGAYLEQLQREVEAMGPTRKGGRRW